jgi:iron complex outermembrane receptor protein
MLAIPGSFYAVVDSATFDAWTPKASVQVEASPGTFLYASATRGFKSGGFNPTAPEPGLAFSPEYAWSYEGGVKRTIAGGRARVNAAMFYTDYRDLQVQSFIRPGVPDVRNAASATIKGVETEVTASGGHGVQLAGYFSWLDATYDHYLAVAPGETTRDVAGHRLNHVPEWSGGASAVYEFSTGHATQAFIRGDVSWQSRVFFTPFNDAIETQGAYGLVHLRAGFGPASRRWEVTAFVRNLANQDYIIGTANVPLPAFTAHPGAPRHWGTQFTLRR